jgi:hypothetical protein
MTRMVRHRVTGRRRDVGVEVGARVGPVRRRRREDAGCNKKPEWQCTYNVKSEHVRLTIMAMENQQCLPFVLFMT